MKRGLKVTLSAIFQIIPLSATIDQKGKGKV